MSNGTSAEDNLTKAAEELGRKQKEGFEHLEAFGESLQRISRANYILEEQEAKLNTYLAKLERAKVGMLDIMNRTQGVQLKLNSIREPHTPQSKALIQEGPFAYKCVHPGGVRYRDYPRHDASILNYSIKHNEVVPIDERVYIAGESLVYLHVKGRGWLFENKDGIIALKRIPIEKLQDTSK